MCDLPLEDLYLFITVGPFGFNLPIYYFLAQLGMMECSE